MRAKNHSKNKSAFGMIEPGRNFTTNIYRYGFNGKEKDDEMKGSGNSIDYGFRMYDPRVGRFMSTDIVQNAFPWQSSYMYAGDMPIWAIDFDGLQPMVRRGNHITAYGTLNGIEYKFKLNISEPQNLEIKTAGQRSLEFDFLSTHAKRKSLALLPANTSNVLNTKLKVRGTDYVEKDVQKMATIYGSAYVTDLISQLLKENPDLELSIVGNNGISFGTTIHTSTGDQTMDATTQIPFNLERAHTVQNYYFAGILNVKTYSQQPSPGLNFPNVMLSPLNRDPVGITMFINFKNLVKGDNKTKATPSKEPSESHINPRFLKG